jgi:hypothetical protein
MAKQCKQATFLREQHLLKRKLPFYHYNVTERKRLLKEPSKAIWSTKRSKQKTTPPRLVQAENHEAERYDIVLKR